MSSKSRPPESMDSLLLLCARRVFTQCPLPALPAHLYPILFNVAFLDRRPQVLQDLVATWPFTELNFQQLVGEQELLQDHDCIDCVQAIIQGVVVQLQRVLEEPSHHFSLRVVDVTRLPDSVSGRISAGFSGWSSTEALANACLEVSKHQHDIQRLRSKGHKGCTGAATAAATPQPLGVDVHADLVVNRRIYKILHHALQTGSTGPLRLKCHKFETAQLSASEIVTLLKSLDPSCVQRVELCYNELEFAELSVMLPHLLHFTGLRSFTYLDEDWGVVDPTSELDIGIRSVARYLGMLPSLRELKLGSSRLSRNLRQILGDLQAPLESLELDSCSLVPADLAFLSQSFHAPALKRLHLSDYNLCEDLLEPLCLLLEEASASLLYLNLVDCHMDDSHLHALLPTLLRCSRLRSLALYSKFLSTAALKDLLQKTLELPDLHQVVYPIPMDCYKLETPDYSWNSVVDEERLEAAKAEFSQMLANSGRINLVWTSRRFGFRGLDYFSL